MKKKIILLIIISTIITFIIYKYNYKQIINITYIDTYNNNDILLTKLNEYIPNSLINIDYSDNTLEIENLLSLIEHNTNNIQRILYKSKVIILSIGNNDSQEKTKTILNEYKQLFKLIRKYNNNEIIFISPPSFKNKTQLKEITNIYKINYINIDSYINNNKIDNNLLTNRILKQIPYIKN